MAVRNRNESSSAALKQSDAAHDPSNKLEPRNWRHLFPRDSGHDVLEADPRVVELLQSLFPQREVVDRLAMVFEMLVERTVANRSDEMIANDLKCIEDPLWMLDEVQYMGYVNFMGDENGRGTFASLENFLGYVMKDLGASVIYALPFLSSPFGDAGFDVSDYRDVDARFGGMKQFQSFHEELAARGGKLKMDLVFNHVSSEHEWAKKALAGDPELRAFFRILDHAPEVVKVVTDSTGLPLAAHYRERDGLGEERVIERRVVFPAFADPAHPHYTKLKEASGRDIWVYHTFYPFQWDLNFLHPPVVEEALGVLAFWANAGADVLRLDAIPHLFKQMESDPRIMKVVELFRHFLAKAAPRTSLLVEANQAPAVVQKYFGEAADIRVDHLDRTMQTSSGAQVAYNFDQAIHSWASLLTGDKSFLLQGLRRTPEPPPNALWANFLRSHDELSLSKAPDEIRDVIQRELIETKRGVPFRGARGVGGRMANFLAHDPRRQKMAFAHLLSLHGHPIIYYGDEIMAPSDHAYARSAAVARGGQYDSRDEGRGPVGRDEFRKALASGATTPQGDVLAYVRRLLLVRKQRLSLRRGQLVEVETDHDGVVAYLRTASNESTLIVFSLRDEALTAGIGFDGASRAVADLISERSIPCRVSEAKFFVKLEPFQACWLAV